jgi:hypothetical protein
MSIANIGIVYYVVNGILRKLNVAIIWNTARFKRNNLSTVALHKVFGESEQTVKPQVYHGQVLRSQFETRVASGQTVPHIGTKCERTEELYPNTYKGVLRLA